MNFEAYMKQSRDAYEAEAEATWGEVRNIFDEIEEAAMEGIGTCTSGDALNALDRINALSAKAEKRTLEIFREITNEIARVYKDEDDIEPTLEEMEADPNIEPTLHKAKAWPPCEPDPDFFERIREAEAEVPWWNEDEANDERRIAS